MEVTMMVIVSSRRFGWRKGPYEQRGDSLHIGWPHTVRMDKEEFSKEAERHSRQKGSHVPKHQG